MKLPIKERLYPSAPEALRKKFSSVVNGQAILIMVSRGTKTVHTRCITRKVKFLTQIQPQKTPIIIASNPKRTKQA